MNFMGAQATAAQGNRRMNTRRLAKPRGTAGLRLSEAAGTRDERFCQLLELARGGDSDAAVDLWHEYGFRFGEEAP
jgi:hypothetical protein